MNVFLFWRICSSRDKCVCFVTSIFRLVLRYWFENMFSVNVVQKLEAKHVFVLGEWKAAKIRTGWKAISIKQKRIACTVRRSAQCYPNTMCKLIQKSLQLQAKWCESYCISSCDSKQKEFDYFGHILKRWVNDVYHYVSVGEFVEVTQLITFETFVLVCVHLPHLLSCVVFIVYV